MIISLKELYRKKNYDPKTAFLNRRKIKIMLQSF